MKEKKFKIHEDRAKMFREIVGDAKSEDIEITNKRSVVSDLLNRGETPPGLRALEGVFNYICTFFTMYLTLAILIGISCKYFSSMHLDEYTLVHVFAPKVLKVLLFSVVSFCAIKIIEFFVSCFFIAYYSRILDKTYKNAKMMEDKIREAVDKEEEPKEKEEVHVDNDNPAAVTFNNIANYVLKYAVETYVEEFKTIRNRTDIMHDISAILYKIFETGKMSYVKDPEFSKSVIDGKIFPEELFEKVLNKDKQLFVYKCIYEAGLKSDWFTK